MRIVHTQDHFYPKLGYQETFLMHAQVRAGHEVHMVTADRNYYNRGQAKDYHHVLGCDFLGARTEILNGFTIHRLETRHTILEKFSRRWLVGLEDKLAALQPDLVIAHGMQSITSLRIARVAKRGNHRYKIIFDSHADEVNSNRSFRSIYYKLYGAFARPLYIQKADGIVAINKWAGYFLVNRLKIPRNKIKVIGFGADTNIFHHKQKTRKKKRRELGLSDNHILFIYTGKVNHYKGVHYFVDAAIKLGQTLNNIAVLVIGSGDSNYLANLKYKASIQSNVRFFFKDLIPNKELPAFYSAADVSVWPDSLSIGTYEAQACEVPLIVSDLSPIMEERVSYGNGLVYSRGNIEDLADKMKYLIVHSQRRAEMARSGRNVIETKLNWDKISDQFIRLVEGELNMG